MRWLEAMIWQLAKNPLVLYDKDIVSTRIDRSTSYYYAFVHSMMHLSQQRLLDLLCNHSSISSSYSLHRFQSSSSFFQLLIKSLAPQDQTPHYTTDSSPTRYFKHGASIRCRYLRICFLYLHDPRLGNLFLHVCVVRRWLLGRCRGGSCI